MIEIEKPRIEIENLSEDGSFGRFVVEPLERGFGNTLGNSLRRVLLSSLEGVAVRSLKIDGVLHEFSTIPGVKEDVTQIVLNMKGLIAKLYCNGEKTVEINAEGPCEVTAANISADSEVEILNPDMHIATLDEGAKLSMEITLNKGRGYVPGERNKALMTNNVIGLLPIDSIYTPVLKVNYTVENTRVGQDTNLQQLTLTIDTDGTITPREAFEEAAAILVNQFTALAGGKSVESSPAPGSSKDEDDAGLMLPIEELELSARTANALLNNDIRTIRDLVTLSETDMKDLKGFGQKALDEVKEKLTELNI